MGKLLPHKTLGDSIEARREALACARQFQIVLDNREHELDAHLTEGLAGIHNMEIVRRRDVGGYGVDGKVTLLIYIYYVYICYLCLYILTICDNVLLITGASSLHSTIWYISSTIAVNAVVVQQFVCMLRAHVAAVYVQEVRG